MTLVNFDEWKQRKQQQQPDCYEALEDVTKAAQLLLDKHLPASANTPLELKLITALFDLTQASSQVLNVKRGQIVKHLQCLAFDDGAPPFSDLAKFHTDSDDPC